MVIFCLFVALSSSNVRGLCLSVPRLAFCEREATELWSLLRSLRLIRLMELVVPSWMFVCIVPARASRCDSSVLHSTSSSFDGISITEAEVADGCRLLDGRVLHHSDHWTGNNINDRILLYLEEQRRLLSSECGLLRFQPRYKRRWYKVFCEDSHEYSTTTSHPRRS